MSRDPAWRDEAASALAAGVLDRLLRTEGPGRALVVGDPRNDVVDRLERASWTVERWDRMARPGRAASAWPPAGPFDLVGLRLDRSKDVVEMELHAALARLVPDGRALLYGAKDEGIRSAAARVEEITGAWTSRATGKRCRVLEWRRPKGVGFAFRGDLDDWRIDLPDGTSTWPGVFGGEGIDPGTDLLLRHLPDPVGPVLDFGAGRGPLAAALVAAGLPANEITLLEPDALAARAAALRLPDAEIIVDAAWPVGRRWGTVVANPPYHEGKAETLSVIESLAGHAAEHLRPGGELRIVVQRRHPVDRILGAVFPRVAAVADEGPYRVWSAVRGRA